MSKESSVLKDMSAHGLAESLANLINLAPGLGVEAKPERIYDNVATIASTLLSLLQEVEVLRKAVGDMIEPGELVITEAAKIIEEREALIQSIRKKLRARDDESDREFFDRIHRDLWLKYTGPSPEVTGEEAENLGRLICDAFANSANEDDDEYFKYEWNDISELAKHRTIKAGKYLTCWAWDEIHALRTEREGLREALIEERQDNRNAGQVLDRGVFDNSSAGVQITIGDLSLEERAEQVVRLWKEEHESRERFEKESENRVRALFWLVYQDYVPKEDQQYALKIADGREKTAVDDPTSYALENYRKVFAEACEEDPVLAELGWTLLPHYAKGRVELLRELNSQIDEQKELIKQHRKTINELHENLARLSKSPKGAIEGNANETIDIKQSSIDVAFGIAVYRCRDGYRAEPTRLTGMAPCGHGRTIMGAKFDLLAQLMWNRIIHKDKSYGYQIDQLLTQEWEELTR